MILVFPAGMPDASRFAAEARARGQQLIGSSSLEFDPVRTEYEHWDHLPYVTDAGFECALTDLVRRRGVTSIFTPHYVIALKLRDLLPTIAPDVHLIEGETLLDQQSAYRALRLRLEGTPIEGPQAPALANARPPLGAAERTGLIRLINSIPGMCSDEKSLALMDIARCTPQGDVVEIGSWWGKSAALLAWLARRYEIGQTLCIDPWRRDCMGQSTDMLDNVSALLDPVEAHRIFEINLAPLVRGSLNYLRMSGHEAVPLYRPGLQIETEAFGATTYKGRIALLHIDGNHAFDHAAEDVADWAPHIMPGGWIVIDDYIWPFGDGPQRVGDAFLEAHRNSIDVSFVAGTALFVQLSSANNPAAFNTALAPSSPRV